MTKEEERRILAAIEGKDVVEVLGVLMCTGNVYSRRILRFFRWFCKWVPVFLMLLHGAAMLDFRGNDYDMFVTYGDNWASYAFTYLMLYVLPMVIILASRFFYLCWKYRVPFFYFFGVNAIHIGYWSWYTTNEMAVAHVCLMVMTGCFYGYAAAEWFMERTRLGRGDVCGEEGEEGGFLSLTGPY